MVRCVSCAALYRKARNRDYLAAKRRTAGAVPIGTIIKCADCGTEFPYSSGPQKRCKTCQKKLEVDQIHQWLDNNPALKSGYRKTAKDNYYFGGNREKCLERDGHRCVSCGTTENLQVHHKDGRGTTLQKDERNNALENLEALCRDCHTAHHHAERRA